VVIRPLIKEFKQDMNRVIWQRLIVSEHQPQSIKQWYKQAKNLDRHWRESRREKERLKSWREIGVITQSP